MDGANDISASRFEVDEVRRHTSANGGAGELQPSAQSRKGRSPKAPAVAGRNATEGVPHEGPQDARIARNRCVRTPGSGRVLRRPDDRRLACRAMGGSCGQVSIYG